MRFVDMGVSLYSATFSRFERIGPSMQVVGASMLISRLLWTAVRATGAIVLMMAVGCGTTKTRLATDQLLVSDAVDQAITGIDFGAMAGKKVFFDSQYIKTIKGIGFVNADYIVSSLRQQMIAADCRLQESKEDADFIIEARVGTLGTNVHEVVYGLPANNAISTAATLMPNAPSLPVIPELSFAKKDAHLGAAKIAVFAYERESRRPVWQSGMSQAKSTAQDIWILGSGPFQRGTVYDGMQFAGSRIQIPRGDSDGETAETPLVDYRDQFYFPRPMTMEATSEIGVVGYEEQLPPVVLAPARPPDSGPARQQPPPSADQPPPPSAPDQAAPTTDSSPAPTPLRAAPNQ